MRDKEWFKITRIRLDLSTEDIAEEMLVTKQTIRNIESGKTDKGSTMLFYERVLLDHLKETPIKELTEEETNLVKDIIKYYERRKP